MIFFLDDDVCQNTSRDQLALNIYPELEKDFTSYLLGDSLTST